MASVRGKIQRVTYSNRDFHILSIEVIGAVPATREYSVTAKGHLCGLVQVTVGITMSFQGEWTTHPKYGRQFNINSWAPWAQDGDAAIRFLHECVDGFMDHSLVKRLVDHFGEDVFDALSSREEAVLALAVPDEEMPLHGSGAIKESTMRRALLSWDRLRTVYELSGLLQDQGIGSAAIQAVFVRFGSDARDIVSKNPYRLLELREFQFAQVDRIAGKMGIERADVRRTQGAVLATLRQSSLDGNVYVRRGDLPLLFGDLAFEAKVPAFDARPSKVEAAVNALAEDKAILIDPEAGVYLPDLYRFERESARMLAEFMTPVNLEVDPVMFLLEYQRANQIDLSDTQREAVEKLLTNRVLVLTGLPGTGKTTVVRTIVNLLKEASLTYRLMAPTGIAAKRMASVTSTEAATIHRTFGYDGENWGYNGARKYSVDAVIIDEMSMVDMELFYRILDALHPSTMLVLVGDDAQLPSVGPGNVLRELIACEAVPNIRLTQIFRQAEKGGIVTNSHRINRGDTLLLDDKDPTSEFRFVHIEDEEKIASLIVEMSAKLKARDANFQVLAPKYDGVVGVDNLNTLLRERLNPGDGHTEWRAGDLFLRDGDRVMVVQNDYKKSIYNGDMAKVLSFNRDDVVIKVHGLGARDVDVVVPVAKSEAKSKLKLAYAVTVHKCVDPETLVETPAGLVPIDQLPDEGLVATPTGRAVYKGLVRNPASPMLNIETVDGYSLRVTPDHRVDRWLEGYSAVRADTLVRGDTLRLRVGHEFDGGVLALLPGLPEREGVPLGPPPRPLPIPQEVNAEVAEFFGMLIADGVVDEKGFYVVLRHGSSIERFDVLCRAVFGTAPRRPANNRIEVNSTRLVRWLRTIGGLDDIRSRRIPAAILASPVHIQASFIRGLFSDGIVSRREDGSVEHIEIHNVPDRVLRHLRVLLLRQGIICEVGSRTGKSHSLAGSRITLRLRTPTEKDDRNTVPVTASEIGEIVAANGGWEALPGDKAALTRTTIPRHVLTEFLGRMKVHPPAWDALLARMHFHHSRIRRIRHYVGRSVCIEVPDGHQFVQDGFCAWNSQGSEWETVILPITRTQGRMLQRNLFYTAVTRAKSKVWLLGHPDAVAKAIGNDLVVQRNTAFGRAVEVAFADKAGVSGADAGQPEAAPQEGDTTPEAP